MNNEIDLINNIINNIQINTGISLNQEKIDYATKKIIKYYRDSKFKNIDEYYDFFLLYKDAEIKKLISLLTNHTTEFFRETEHFDFLVNDFFPKYIKNNIPIRIWSAAASTGQEVYSIVICFLEACSALGVSIEKTPQFEILGTDIDALSIEKCNSGIYLKKQVQMQMNQELIHKYFDVGKGELNQFVRIKDFVHNLCKFKVQNLFFKPDNFGIFNLIFVRNVLIYYKLEEIKKITLIMQEHLDPNGILILGQSESLSRIESPFTHIKNSIYNLKKPKKNHLTSIFIIDDSKTIRESLKLILTEKEGFTVVGEAENPVIAMKMLENLKEPPNVISLDINMPEMTGIQYLEHLKNKTHPPIVVMSSIGQAEAEGGVKCLELGAFDYIEKPKSLHSKESVETIKKIFHAARNSNINYKNIEKSAENKVSKVNYPKPDLIAIGSSTGGVEALKTILPSLKGNFPPILIVQHIPESFSAALAASLNAMCILEVVEAKNLQPLENNFAYLAPGGKQMRVIERNNKLVIEITDEERVNLHKPSVDYLFHSLASLKKKINISAVILTGMGNDGAKGLKELYDQNAFTMAQNEASSIVFGMPKEAISLGGVQQVLHLKNIADVLNNLVN